MVVFVLLLPALLFGALLAMELVEARLQAERRMERVENRVDPRRSPFVDEASRR